MVSPLATGELPVGAEKTQRVREMFDTIAPRYEAVNRLITLGLDARWRTRTVRALGLPRGSVIVDVATGTGELCSVATKEGFEALGFDLSFGMLSATGSALPRAQCDAAALPVASGVADGVVCGFALRNFTDRVACLTEMSRVLRSGGRLALLEVGAPERALTRRGFDVWFNKVVPLVGAAVSDADAYRYLPRSVAYLPTPDALRDELCEAGFSSVNRHLLSGGLSQLVVATKRGRS
jgi:demethylmenaquinone methyltransferase/2-methoxy-6-polyprenyl-1,4-benzoquinol methylase